MTTDPIEPIPTETQGPATSPEPRSLSLQAKLLVAAVALLALGVLFWPRGDGSFEAPGGFLLDPDGRPTTLGERFAPVTLLHFWATWCPPCITEIPSLQRLAADVGGRDDFALLMVAVDDEAENVANFLGDRSAWALFDPNWEVAHRYGTRKVPETYLLVGRKVVDKYIGQVDWDDPEIRRRLAEKVREHRRDGPTFGVELR